MIKVSLECDPLIVGQRTQVAIHLANAGPGTCTDVAFHLRLAPGMTLLRGVARVDIPELPEGRAHVHHVTVRPTRDGNMAFTSSNFAYRDQFGVHVRDNDFSWPVSVLPSSQRPASAPLRRRLEVVSAPGRFTVGELAELRIMVRNATSAPISDATVAINGPFESHGSRVKPLGELSARASRTVPFTFRTDAEGPLTVTVHTAYSYRDERGLVFNDEQPDSLRLVVEPKAARTPPDPPPATSPVRTILYISAQPRDLPPLQTDKEFREVKERLQLGRNRDRFRLEPPYIAARRMDVGQALVDHDPYIVHFAGHGEQDGSIYVQGDSGLSEPADPEGLAELFGLYSRSIKCVIVNACHSVRLAEAIAKHIDYAIGMRSAIGDEASITFSLGFYQALSSGQAVPDAYKHAKAMIRTGVATSPEHLTPVLFSRS